MSQPTHQRRWLQFCQTAWPALKFLWGAIVLGLVINVGSTFLTTRGFNPQGTPLEWMMGHLVIILLCAAGLLIFTMIIWNGNRKSPASVAQTTLRQPTEQNRKAFLGLLQNEYRRQLIQSLQGVPIIPLAVQERTDIIQAPAQLISWRVEKPDERSLHTSIIEAYDEAGQGLLILGAPGSGKSTLLRELASELLTRAGQDLTYPLPVILNLSSWAEKKRSLLEWVVEQLQLVYALPRDFSHAWTEQNAILLFLDGLDEVEASARTACIEKINAYRREHFVPLVVCSRSREYIEQVMRLQVPLAAEVQPFTSQHVEYHLKRGGKSLTAVRAVLKSNIVLHDLITTPLMLSIVVAAYRDKTVKDLPQLGTAEQQQQQIFAAYVQRMLEQSTRTWDYSSQQTQTWLIWLAKQMKQRSLTEFYLEWLQLDWLSTKQLQDACKLLFGLLVGLLFGLIGGLIGGLLFGLIVGLLVGLLVGLDTEIRPSEKLISERKQIQKYVVGGMIGGLLFGLLVGQIVGLSSGLLVGLLVGQSFGLLVGQIVGISSIEIHEHTRLRPNQGIQSFGENALRLMLSFGLLSGLSFWLIFGQIVGLLIGLSLGLLGGLLVGGGTYLLHYVLRFFLWRCRAMPWRYVHFLEEATERILLQRVGGGYHFIHPLFLDYFASLEDGSTPSNANQQPPQQ